LDPITHQLLDDAALGAVAAKQLSATLLVFDAFHDVADKAKAGNANAQVLLIDFGTINRLWCY
jgi:aconitate hydratase 2/2-methylisocitrate dehydratase